MAVGVGAARTLDLAALGPPTADRFQVFNGAQPVGQPPHLSRPADAIVAVEPLVSVGQGHMALVVGAHGQ